MTYSLSVQMATNNVFEIAYLEQPNITEGENVTVRCQPDRTPDRIVWTRNKRVIYKNHRQTLLNQNQTLVIINSRKQYFM